MFQLSQSIADCNNELNLVGQRVSTTDYLLYFHRANRYFNTHYKMPTTQRNQDYLVFTGVYEYPLPTDFLAQMPLERPYEIQTPKFDHTAEKAFVEYRHGQLTSIKFDKENQYLLINYEGGNKDLIDGMDTFDGNGTWVVSDDGSNIASDSQYFTSGTGSIRFTVTPSAGYTTLTNTTLNDFYLDDYKDNGFVFLDLFNPNDTSVTSVRIRLGNNATNYYEMTATKRYNGQSIINSFGQIGFDLSTKTTVGSPADAMNYCEIRITGGAAGVYRVDNLMLALPYYFRLPYYSIYNVKTSTGTYLERPTSIDDYILCPNGFEEAYTYKVLEYAAVEKLEDNGLANYFKNELVLKENQLKTQYPRQNALIQSNWYHSSNRF